MLADEFPSTASALPMRWAARRSRSISTSTHRWTIGHSIEEAQPDEMQTRYTEEAKKGEA